MSFKTNLNFKIIKDTPENFEEIFKLAGNQSVNESTYGRCLSYILAELNWQGEIWDLTEALPHLSEVFDDVDLFNTLANLGYKSSKLDLSPQEIDPRLFPALFIPQNDPENVMVILSRKKENFEIYDSVQNKVILRPIEDLEQGTGYFFNSMKDEEHHYDRISVHIPPSPFRWFLGVAFRLKSHLKQALWTSFFINFFNLFSSLYVMIVYDKVISVQAGDSVKYLLSGILIAIGCDFFLRQVRLKIFAWFGVRLDSIISPAIFERIMGLPPKLTESASLSTQVARVRDFETIREFFTGPVMMAVIEIPFVLVMITAIFIIAGYLAAVPLLLLLIYYIFIRIMFPRIRYAVEENGRTSSKRYNMTVDTINKLKAIKIFGNYRPWLDQFRLASGAASFSSFRMGFLNAIIETISYAIYVTAGVATLSYGIYLVINETISSGALITSMILTWRILSPMQTFISSLSMFTHLEKSITQVHKLLSMPPERPFVLRFKPVPRKAPSITFYSLLLRHGAHPEVVFNGLNLQIKAGELIMLVGRNGSGKSSLLKLINGIYNPQNGGVKINEFDIRQYDINELRRNIGYVPEKPDFFFGTIAQNLRLSNPSATDKEIKTLLNQVGCLEAVNKLPEGIGYHLGDSNTDLLPNVLSYQLNLARALIRDPILLLVDEAPHSFINSQSREKLIKMVKSWKGKKTTIMVAQTEEMFMLADRIIFLLGDGRAVAGNPAELLNVLKQQFNYNFD